MKIIGITGPAGSGKTTVANMILKARREYELKAFAGPLKNMLRIGLGLSHEQIDGPLKEIIDDRYGCTARYMMQTLGTEWGRNMIDQNVWLNAAISTVSQDTVFGDVRFLNEAEYCRKQGVLVHVARPGMVMQTHQSESGVEYIESDFIIENTGTMVELEDRVKVFLSVIATSSGRIEENENPSAAL